MSYDEIIYRIDNFPSIEMNNIHVKDNSWAHQETKEKSIIILDCNNNISRERKKVSFPDGDNIVSHYFEYENYWHKRRLCSCDEILVSYKKSCEQNNIKPIPLLLEQVKGIDVSICNERYDMLNLSNIKLDLKHVQSMEEIFKRVQFRTLNFENTNLDDECSSSLFEIIEYYESCLKLNLSHNGKITYAGFMACCRMLKKTQCLETIELRGTIFTDATISALNRALKCGCNLKVLHLENSNICAKNLLILLLALKLNVNLRELHLSCNRMVPADGIQLGILLKVNRWLERLDVRNNALGDVVLSHICDGLSDQFRTMNIESDNGNHGTGLRCLVVYNNYITDHGMPYLSRALKATKSLQSLNIGNNPISSEGVHILREGLFTNRTLLKFSVSCCKITCEGGIAIAEYLADTRNLMWLDLRDNDIKTAGLMALSLSMKVNKSVTRLDVDPQPKRDMNVKEFYDTQMKSLYIIRQQLEDNKRLNLEYHHLELSQSSLSLSNEPRTLFEGISACNYSLTNQDHSTDPTSLPDSEEGFQSVNNGGTSLDTDSLNNLCGGLLSPRGALLAVGSEMYFDDDTTVKNMVRVECDLFNKDEWLVNEKRHCPMNIEPNDELLAIGQQSIIRETLAEDTDISQEHLPDNCRISNCNCSSEDVLR